MTGVAGTDPTPWLAVGALMVSFVTLLAVLKVISVRRPPHPELLRKILHVGSGLMTLTFPFLFSGVWPVLLLCAAAASVIAVVKFVPCCHRRFGDVIEGNQRSTAGELYFPAGVATVFWLARGQSTLLFLVPVVVLTIADATAALVGIAVGRNRYGDGSKSLEGSAAFFAAALLCVQVMLTIFGNVAVSHALLISISVALLLTLVEGIARRGLDNLLVPAAAYGLLHQLLVADERLLMTWLLASVALSTIVFVSIRRVTSKRDVTKTCCQLAA